MKALITGITGFVGQYLAEHLLGCGDDVLGINFDDHWPADASAIVRDRAALLRWDLPHRLPDATRRSIERFAPDCVYHLAAVSVPGECGETEPKEQAWAVNVQGTRCVVDLATSLAPRPRLLVVSSAHVYAPVSRERPIVDEDAPVGPKGAYGKTKHEAEKIALCAAQDGLDVIVARAFQHSGPRQAPKFLLPEWAEQFARPGEGPIHVLSLDSFLDLSDVRDVVRAYRALIERKGTKGCYNVGRGESVRSGDVFRMLSELAGKPRQVIERRPGLRQEPIADISRLVAQTQWRPRITLQQTVADTLRYWQVRHVG